MVDAARAIYPTGPSNSLGNDPVGDDSFRAALTDMNLTPQEQNLYKMHLENLSGPGGVDNPDGSRSTLKQITVEANDKAYNIPTVWEGKVLSNEEAMKRVDAYGWHKFPSYDTEDKAQARYDAMHSYMEKDTAKYLA